jgi:hypothetical protein
MPDRSFRDFQVPFVVAPVADAWASANHFALHLVEPDGSRHYVRGSGLLTGQMMCVVRQAGPNVRIEAWIHARLLARISALFLIPTDMSVEPGGMKGVLPRKMCRDAVNALLAQLGQPPIGQPTVSTGQPPMTYPSDVPAAPQHTPPGGPAALRPPSPAPEGPPQPGQPWLAAASSTAGGYSPTAGRPMGIGILTVVEIVTAVIGLFVVQDLAYWANWRFSYDDFGWGVLDAAIALAYLAASLAGFAIAWRLWSMRPDAWLPAVLLSSGLIGLYAFSALLWGLTIREVIGIAVHLGLISYLNLKPVRALFGRPPMPLPQGGA